MILIDTNVVSEMMKPSPNKIVLDWIDNQEVDELFISTITLAEISYGLNVLPDGQRRDYLERSFVKAILEAFTGRILAFDDLAAYQYGKIMGHRKNLGKPLGVPDGQIAAIASVHNAIVATRNVRDFVDCGLQLINPFENSLQSKH